MATTLIKKIMLLHESPLYIKELASGIAFLLTFLLFVPYIRAIKQNSTTPHLFSWVVWSFGTFVVFFAQLSDGAGIGAWPIGLSACLTSYVAVLAHQVRSRIKIVFQDWLLAGLSLVALPCWIIASDPFWAVFFLTFADLLGFGPTLRKAYSHPHQEHAGFFAMGAVRNLFVIVALQHYSWTTMLFPLVVGATCLLIAGFILLRRTTIEAS